MKKQKKITGLICIAVILGIFTFSVIQSSKKDDSVVQVNSSTTISNKKIAWGIKRNDNHEQPDLGAENKEILEKYEGICIGNKEKKEIVITFDEGYEAGYTSKILDILKENDVKATFFITSHYVNTASELVQRMIDEGHIVGNHTPKYLMS